jgi:hypothetical protein
VGSINVSELLPKVTTPRTNMSLPRFNSTGAMCASLCSVDDADDGGAPVLQHVSPGKIIFIIVTRRCRRCHCSRIVHQQRHNQNVNERETSPQ